jgi:c(7)-type cytochrome triheme protein
MKKILILSLALIFTMASMALAVTKSKDLVFDKSPMGKVTFSGKTHSAFKCGECHNPDMFAKKKKGAVTIKMAELYAGKYCGKCHDGKTAFKAMGNCIKCHKK